MGIMGDKVLIATTQQVTMMYIVFAALVAVASADVQVAQAPVVQAAPAQAPVVSLIAKPAEAPMIPKYDSALVGAFNDDMMAYYYLWIVYISLASKVQSAGGWVKGKSADLEKIAHKPIKAFKKLAKIEEDSDSDDEPAFLEVQKKKKGADTTLITVKYLDLAANWHITANTYAGLAADYKAMKKPTYSTYLSLWTNLVKLNWQYALIYTDYLSIMNQYNKVEFLEKMAAYTNRLFDAFATMWMTSSYVALYTAITTPMSSSRKALDFVKAINGIELARGLKQIALITYLSEFKVPCASVFEPLVPFILGDFSIKALWNSGTTRVQTLIAK